MLLRILILLLPFSVAVAQEASPYNYPFPNPYQATITAAINGAFVPFENVSLQLKPSRLNVKLVGELSAMKLALFKQKNKSPLAFVIAGTGGGAYSGNALFIGSLLYKAGYTVVTLPNPISWQYVLGYSTSEAVGYIPRDTQEYSLFLQEILKNLKQQYNLKYQDISLVGYSYGALTAAFLGEQDQERKIFDFKKIVLINPAWNIRHGVEQLDGFYEIGQNYSPEKKSAIMSRVLTIGSNFLDRNMDFAYLKKAVDQWNPPNSHAKWVIGSTFRDSLGDLLFAMEQIKPRGILKTPVSWHHRSERLNEAKTFSFSAYMNKILIPSLRLQGNEDAEEDIYFKGGLYSLKSYIASNDNIYLIQNQDDFLFQKSDEDFVTQSFGARRTYYPTGGHMGNLWYPQNQKDLIQAIKGI